MISGMLMFFFTAGAEIGGGEAVQLLDKIKSCCLSLSPVNILGGISVTTLLVSIYAFKVLPEFAMRFAAVTLTHTIYKLRIRGMENLPEHGPALLVANHVSFVDGFLISACSSRIIRFLMHEDYYNLPLFRHVFKWLGFIEVPSPNKPKGIRRAIETTREALRNGDIVCIFPEGKLTRNGVMDEFKSGFCRMIPDDMDIPVIPLRLGMIWGSIFSYYHGSIRPRWPMEFPHPAAVTIGKPVPKDLSPFAIRQQIAELAAETEMTPRDEERPLHYQFAKLAKRHPFRHTIKEAEGKSISNFSLLVRATLLSREIRRLSRPEETYVGVMLPNCIAAAATVLGVMSADKVPAMLNFSASRESLDSAVRKADLKVILTSRLFIKKAKIAERPEMVFLEDMAKKISFSSRLSWSLLAALLPRQELMNIVSPESHRDVFRTAVLLFSSGSTAEPKGVLLSHHNINSNVYSFMRIVGLRRWHDSLVGNLPLFHSFGITTNLWISLMTGTRIVYLPNPLDAAGTGQAIADNKLTILLATPTFLQAYLRKCPPEQFKSLRLVALGAERMRPELAEKFRRATGLTPLEGYGCTELSPVVSVNIANSFLNLGTQSGPVGSAGMPMPGICVKIVEPETLETLSANKEGLMLVKGANVMQGYLKNPEQTSAVLWEGWYNTGDIAKMDNDGRITITGRLSRFSKIGGEMVPHEMVEQHLMDILHAEERCLAVCSVPDAQKGEKLVVLHTDLAISPEELVKQARDEGKLPNLWIPRPDNFQQIKTIPLLGSGKLDVKEIQQLAKNFAK